MARKNKKVWSFFDNNLENGLATCKICKNKLKNNRIYNLRTHLIKMHNIKLEQIYAEQPEVVSLSSASTSTSRLVRKKSTNEFLTKARKNKKVWSFFDNNSENDLATCKICNNKLKKNHVYNLKMHLIKMHNIKLEQVYAEQPESASLSSASTSTSRLVRRRKIKVGVNKCSNNGFLSKAFKNKKVWSFFDNNSENDLATCKICKNKLKNNRLYNLRIHLIRMHNIKLEQIYAEQPEVALLSSASTLTSRLVRKQKIKIKVNKKELLRSYIGLVTEDCIPFDVLNSPNLKNFIDPICEGLKTADGKSMSLNAANCKKTLETVANIIRDDIASEVKDRLLSIKIDRAPRLCRNIFGVSVQYISDIQIKSRIIGMVELEGAGCSTGRNLANEVLKVLQKYNINLKHIVSVTSDDGESEENSANDEYIKKIEEVELPPDMLLGSIQVCRCAAHTAQLVALDVTKSSYVLKHLLTSRNLTKYIRKTSNGYREIFELKKLKMPQLDCPTRWGSTYTMLEDLKAAKDLFTKVSSLKTKNDDENFEVDASFWEFIEQYCLIFNPLQKMIKKFQEEQLHYGDFYAQWLKFKISTEKIINGASQTVVTTIGKIILKSIEERTEALMNNKCLIACLFLDPRFHHILTAFQRADAIDYLKTIWDRINELFPTGALCVIPNSIFSTSNNQNQFSDEEDELLNEYLSEGVKPNLNRTIDVYSKIENLQLPFQRIDTNVLMFWKEKQTTDPELYAISVVCFAVPSTQVTVERAFSTLSLVLTDNRNRLSQEMLENILLVKLNPSFIDEAIDTLPLFQNDEDV